MYFRAIIKTNNGQRMEYEHFISIREAYISVRPSKARCEEESWNIKFLSDILTEFSGPTTDLVTVGWTQMVGREENDETILYIQKVDEFGDDLPSF
jgi:hypothetical protein